MRKAKLIGLAVIGFAGFMVCLAGAGIIFDAYKAGKTDDIGLLQISMAIAGFIISGVCLGLFEYVQNEGKKEQPAPTTKKETKPRGINEGNLIGGVILICFSIYEFSTFYFTNNYLVPSQDSRTLKHLFSLGLMPIVFGLWGARNLYNELPYILRFFDRFLSVQKPVNNDKTAVSTEVPGIKDIHRYSEGIIGSNPELANVNIEYISELVESYSKMEDERLREIKPETLTDIALKCYEAEMQRRKLI